MPRSDTDSTVPCRETLVVSPEYDSKRPAR